MHAAGLHGGCAAENNAAFRETKRKLLSVA
jgi:hypothetical protein